MEIIRIIKSGDDSAWLMVFTKLLAAILSDKEMDNKAKGGEDA